MTVFGKPLSLILYILVTWLSVLTLVEYMVFGLWFARMTKGRFGPPCPSKQVLFGRLFYACFLVLFPLGFLVYGWRGWELLLALILGRAIRETILWWKVGRASVKSG